MPSKGKKLAYFDCFSGASGDMILGALIDAGAPVEPLIALPGVIFEAEAHNVALGPPADTAGQMAGAGAGMAAGKDKMGQPR